MARKQFVSSKKNAPSRAVSSKEAALQGRHPSAGDVESDDDHSGDGANSPSSDISSAPSSPVSSDDEDGAVSDDGETAADPADSDRENDSVPPVTVQVMPASVGRGKQLRFPTGISRGKEVRPFNNGSDREGSDSESYASLASDEEDEPHSGGEEDVAEETPSTVKLSVSVPLSPPSKPESRKEQSDEEISYPIKAARARKRHRPDSGYFSQMSTHIRDCLLSVRDSATASDVFRDDVHDDFRRKLSNGTVERVQWKAASPPPASEASSKSEKKPPKSRSETDSRESRRSKKAANTSAVKEESKAPDSPKRDTSTSTTTTNTDKQKRSSSSSSSRKRERPSEDKESRQSSPATAAEPSVVQEPKQRRRSSHTDAESNGTCTSGHSPTETNAFVCIKCQSKGDGQNQPDSAKEAAPPASTTAPTSTQPPPVIGSFTVPTGPIKDIKQLQTMVARLEQEARSLKHEGNRRGQADPGPRGQVAQGVYFLRSSAKFFQQALLLADMKAAFIELGDERSARSRGDNCIMMLGQTTSLIRSTVSAFHAAGNRRLVALGYKFASIVHLTIYRLRHQRVFAYYSDLSAPSRSPDSRTNGTTPPITGANNSSADSKEAAIKALIVKEMEHTMRGFEMWQRYESLQVEVLPRITNPAVVDLTTFLDDLAQELDKSE